VVAVAAILVDAHGEPMPSGRARGFSNSRPLTPPYQAGLSTEAALTWEKGRCEHRDHDLRRMSPSHRAVATVYGQSPEASTAPLSESAVAAADGQSSESAVAAADDLSSESAVAAADDLSSDVGWVASAELTDRVVARTGVEVTISGSATFTVTNDAGLAASVEVVFVPQQAQVSLCSTRQGIERTFVLKLDEALHTDPTRLEDVLVEQLDAVGTLLTMGRIADAISGRRETITDVDRPVLEAVITELNLTPLKRATVIAYVNGGDREIGERTRDRLISALSAGGADTAQRQRLCRILTGERILLSRVEWSRA
jgi:hypothetical protein